jgi:hypothetical protein
MSKPLAHLVTLVVLAIAAPLSAQSMDHGKDHHAESGWKELDAFHTLMAATWHPAKSNDLKPIRAKADSLSLAAQVWSKSKVPTACNTEPLKAAIADVVAGSAKVEQLVARNAADTEVRAALHDVHERFEVVEKGCKPSKHH